VRDDADLGGRGDTNGGRALTGGERGEEDEKGAVHAGDPNADRASQASRPPDLSNALEEPFDCTKTVQIGFQDPPRVLVEVEIRRPGTLKSSKEAENVAGGL